MLQNLRRSGHGFRLVPTDKFCRSAFRDLHEPGYDSAKLWDLESGQELLEIPLAGNLLPPGGGNPRHDFRFDNRTLLMLLQTERGTELHIIGR
jgi:hypothetical protein